MKKETQFCKSAPFSFEMHFLLYNSILNLIDRIEDTISWLEFSTIERVFEFLEVVFYKNDIENNW